MKTTQEIWEEMGYVRATEEQKEFLLKADPSVAAIASMYRVPLKQLVFYINPETHRIQITRERKNKR